MRRTTRVLLVNPPYQRLRGMSSPELPLGLLYIAAVLRKNGIEAKVLNLEEASKGEDLKSGYLNAFKSYYNYVQNRDNEAHPAWQEYREFMDVYQPDIIGFSVMTPSYALALSMARFTKKLSDAFIVFGGPHPTLCPEDAAKDTAVDAVIVGEGETAFLQLAKLFEHGPKDFLHNVPSAVFRGNDGIVSTALQPLIENLDALPYPDYESLVRPAPSELQNRYSVIVSRGCPYRCAFCVDHLIWRKRTRFRTHEHVTDEIKYLYGKYDLGNLFFQQDSFLNKPELARAVSADLVRARIRIPWWCAARVDQIHQELLRTLKESGLAAVILGIESGSQRILDIMNKKISIPQIERSVALLKENGIKAYAFFMIGVPDETEDDILQTMSLMKRLPLDFMSLSVFTPLPQSVLFYRCVELGLIDQKPDWDKFDYQSPENYFSAAIERERFKALLEQCSALVDEMNSKPH
jgi:radical SAM superfamily enzyme YgiQ (UPF0313 family)